MNNSTVSLQASMRGVEGAMGLTGLPGKYATLSLVFISRFVLNLPLKRIDFDSA